MSHDDSPSTAPADASGGESSIPADPSSSSSPDTKLPDSYQPQSEYAYIFAGIPKNHVLTSNAFMDTFAILMLLLQLPTWLTLIVHFVFIVTLSPSLAWRNVTQPLLPLIAVFTRFLPSSIANMLHVNNASSNATSTQSQTKTSTTPKNQASLLRVLLIDLLFAVTTLYLTPILRNVVLVFAHAIVASSLGGGQRTFLNAIYATSIIETVSFFWDILCEFFHLEHAYSDIVTSASPRLLRYNIGHSLGTPAIATSAPFSAIMDESQSFNTLTSVFNTVPTLYRFLARIDWYMEFPLLLVQMVAVYVVWLTLSPFLKGELASSLSSENSDPSSSSIQNGPSNGQSTPTLTTAPADVIEFDDSVQFTTYTEDGVRDVVVISVPDEVASHTTEPDDVPLNNDIFLYGTGKRNKKAALVRNNQPLWSILASSIVMAARQESVNTRQLISPESLELLHKSHQLPAKLDSGSFGCYVGFVLEKAVGFFVTGLFTASPERYIVRVNQVQWRQTVIKFVNVSDDAIHVKTDSAQDDGMTVIDVSKEDSFDTVFITVHGLTGGTVYDMEIIQMANDQEIVIGRSKVCTAPTEANANQAIAPPSRPLSPVTTLLDTLSQSQVTLSEVKNAMKRSRKEHAKKMNTIRNEIEQIRVKSESNDKTDERVRRKLLSLQSSVKQLEADIKAAEQEAVRLEAESKEYANVHAAHKKEWKEAMELLESRRKAEGAMKTATAKKVQDLLNEKAAILSKREKLATKKERLNGDITKIEQDLDQAIKEELGRRKLAREGKMERRKKLVDEFSTAITQMENGMNELKSRTQNIWVSYQTHQGSLGGGGSSGHLEVPQDMGGAFNIENSPGLLHAQLNQKSMGAFDFNLATNQTGTFSNGFFNHGLSGDTATEEIEPSQDKHHQSVGSF